MALPTFEKNQRLVYMVIWRHFPSLIKDEDARQVALIGLWLAIQRFDPSRGTKFSTYATGTIRGYLLEHIKYQKRHTGPPTVSLDEVVPNTDGLRYIDSLLDPAPGPEEISVKRDDVRCALSRYPQLVQKAKFLHGLGYSQCEIGRMFGISQGHVSRLISA